MSSSNKPGKSEGRLRLKTLGKSSSLPKPHVELQCSPDLEALNSSTDDSLTDFRSPKQSKSSKLINLSKPPTRSSKDSHKRKLRKDEPRPNQQSIPSFFAKSKSENSTFVCPVCLRTFSAEDIQLMHTKSCATKNNISTTKLLKAVELQERQGRERKAIGLPAKPLQVPQKKRVARKPQETGDQELHLALALSISLKESEHMEVLEEGIALAAESDDKIWDMTLSQRKSTLQSFGFFSNKPVCESRPDRSRKKKLHGPTVLQSRTTEMREQLLTEKIAEILVGTESITQAQINPPRPEKISRKLRSDCLRKWHNSPSTLWTLSSSCENPGDYYVIDLQQFFNPPKKSTPAPEEPNQIDQPSSNSKKEWETCANSNDLPGNDEKIETDKDRFLDEPNGPNLDASEINFDKSRDQFSPKNCSNPEIKNCDFGSDDLHKIPSKLENTDLDESDEIDDDVICLGKVPSCSQRISNLRKESGTEANEIQAKTFLSQIEKTSSQSDLNEKNGKMEKIDEMEFSDFSQKSSQKIETDFDSVNVEKMDGANVSYDSLKSPQKNNSVPENSEKNCAITNLSNDWSKMLNNTFLSDISIVIDDKSSIPAHNLVLWTRCNLITNDYEIFTETNNEKSIKYEVHWPNIERNAALIFLKYIYCGQIPERIADENIFAQLKFLGEKYKVSELLQFFKVNENRGKCEFVEKYGVNEFSNTEKMILDEEISPKIVEAEKADLEIGKLETITRNTNFEEMSDRASDVFNTSPDFFEDSEIFDNSPKTSPKNSPRIVQKQKSDLSCFIEKIDRQQARGILESDTDGDTPIKLVPLRKKNPFKIGAHSDADLDVFNSRKSVGIYLKCSERSEVKVQKGSLSLLEQEIRSRACAKSSTINCACVEDPGIECACAEAQNSDGACAENLNGSSEDEVDDSLEESMYTKYINKVKENSISDYRKVLIFGKSSKDKSLGKKESANLKSSALDISEELDFDSWNEISDKSTKIGETSDNFRNLEQDFEDNFAQKKLSIGKSIKEISNLEDLNFDSWTENSGVNKLSENYTNFERKNLSQKSSKRTPSPIVLSSEDEEPMRVFTQIPDFEREKSLEQSPKIIERSDDSSGILEKSFGQPEEFFESPENYFGSEQNQGVAKTILESRKKILRSPNKILESPKKFLESPDEIYESSKKFLESPNEIFESPKKLLKSPNKILVSPKKIDLSEKKFEKPRKNVDQSELFAEQSEKLFHSSDILKAPLKDISDGNRIFSSQENPLKRQRAPSLQISYCVTPPRDYDKMETVELVQELNRYGLKPQKRFRAIQLLQHIYNELHPLVPVDALPLETANEDRDEEENEEPVHKKRILDSGALQGKSMNGQGKCKSPEVDAEVSDDDDSSKPPEEMDFPQEINKLSVGKSIGAREAFNRLLKNDRKLHVKVLMYEPLPLEEICERLKSEGFRGNINDVMGFFDDESITFQVQVKRKTKNSKKLVPKK